MAIVATLLGEAADAIDSPYLHIGGDEADLTMWRQSGPVAELAARSGGFEGLRAEVNAELVRIVLGLGRRPIAWDEALDRTAEAGGPAPEVAQVLRAASDWLLRRGATVQMIACTEFSLLAGATAGGVTAFDTLDVLVGAIRDFAIG